LHIHLPVFAHRLKSEGNGSAGPKAVERYRIRGAAFRRELLRLDLALLLTLT